MPFYSISGSDFVEMFVGVGASRVRDLFEQAKANAPAIIFVDEIDAVGRHRGAGLGGGHDEREQTLNQLLVEMDGFDVKTNVILIAATNRPDILDPALLRPGRFDRQIAVDAPDMQGRNQILKVHAKGKPMAPGVDLMAVARRTPGFTGADLANVLNEAALLTARSDGKVIDDAALDEAIDRVVAGPQKRSRIMNDKEKKITAYHEGGHALVAAALPHTDPVTKVTILPRGRALGYTMVHAAGRQVLHDPQRDARPAGLRDGRPGRRGARLPRPDHRRRQRHREGHRPGPQDGHPVRHERAGRRDQARLGQRRGLPRPRHGPPARLLRGGRRRRRRGGPPLVETAHDEAWEILVEHREVLDDLVLALLERETLNKDDLAEIFAPVHKRAERPIWLSSERRPISELPPVLTPAEKAAQNGHRQPRDGGHDRNGRGDRQGGRGRRGPGPRGAPGDPGHRGARRRHRRPRHALLTWRRSHLRSTCPGPRRRSASCCSRSARTRTARACGRRRPGWRGPTARSSRGLAWSRATS